MLSFLTFVVYFVLAVVMAIEIIPYSLRADNQRALLFSSGVTAIGIIAALVAIHFLVEFILDLFIGFHFSHLFSMKTVVALFFCYMAINVMRIPMTHRKFV